MIDRFELQKLTEMPIESVASRLGLEVTRHKCLCPFHADKHPSLTFNVHTNRYRCFVCGESGNTIDLTMRILHKNFVEACHWLADSYNVILSEKLKEKSEKLGLPSDSIPNSSLLIPNSFEASRYLRFIEHPWLSPEAKQFLFDVRYLDSRVINWCRLNSYKDKHGNHWLQIPYFDQNWKLIGIQSRNLDYQRPLNESEGMPRFRFPQGSQCTFYNLPVLNRLQGNDDLYIAEGCSDCWSLLSSGHKAIAIPSATLLKARELETLFSSIKEKWDGTLHMFPDQDEPGERLFLQIRDLTQRLGVKLEHHQLPSGCKDYSDFYIQQIVKCKA